MNTLAFLTELMQQQFGVNPEQIKPDSPFADYDLDSLTLAELMCAVEDRFHVQVPEQAVPSLASLRSLALLVDELRTAREA